MNKENVPFEIFVRIDMGAPHPSTSILLRCVEFWRNLTGMVNIRETEKRLATQMHIGLFGYLKATLGFSKGQQMESLGSPLNSWTSLKHHWNLHFDGNSALKFLHLMWKALFLYPQFCRGGGSDCQSEVLTTTLGSTSTGPTSERGREGWNQRMGTPFFPIKLTRKAMTCSLQKSSNKKLPLSTNHWPLLKKKNVPSPNSEVPDLLPNLCSSCGSPGVPEALWSTSLPKNRRC